MRARNALLLIGRAAARRAIGGASVLSLAVVGGAVVALATYWVLHLGTELHPLADSAIIEVNVQDAAYGRMLTGPYSRFGWNHPGPLLFVLLAPLYFGTGRNPVALHLGVALLNGASALLAVAVVRRIAHEPAARWAAGVTVLLLAGVSPAELAGIWNPNLLAVPLLLFLVLCAAVWARRTVSWWLAAALVGSFLVQTHVSVLGLVGVLLLLAAASVAVATARRREPPQGRRGPVVAGALALAVVWAPPLFESFPRVPQNVLRIGGFLLRENADVAAGQAHDLRSAVAVVVRRAATVPLGLQGSSLEVTDDLARVLVVLVGGAASVIALVLSARRGKPFGVALALTSLIGLVLPSSPPPAPWDRCSRISSGGARRFPSRAGSPSGSPCWMARPGAAALARREWRWRWARRPPRPGSSWIRHGRRCPASLAAGPRPRWPRCSRSGRLRFARKG